MFSWMSPCHQSRLQRAPQTPPSLAAASRAATQHMVEASESDWSLQRERGLASGIDFLCRL